MSFASSGGSFLACSLGLRHLGFVGGAAPTGVCAAGPVGEFGRLVPRLLTRASPTRFYRASCSDWRLRSGTTDQLSATGDTALESTTGQGAAVPAFAARHRHASGGSLVSAGDHDVGVDAVYTGSKFFEVGGDAVER